MRNKNALKWYVMISIVLRTSGMKDPVYEPAEGEFIDRIFHVMSLKMI